MKQKLLVTACLLVAGGHASATIVTPGSTLTTGPTSDGHSLFSATFNPAAAALTVDENERWRISYFPSFSMSTELGDVNDFTDEVDELINILDDPSLAEGSVEATLDHFNTVLGKMGDEGYLKFSAHVTPPLFPVYWQPRFLPGTLFSEVSLSTQIKASLLDDELVFNESKQGFDTATSAYIKSGIQTQFALGYAQELIKLEHVGSLYGGIKANVYKLDLSKQIARLQGLEGEDIAEYMGDAYDENLRSTVNLGIDVGFTWVADKYRTGLTVKNINGPSFDYGPVGVDCTEYADASFERSNCEAAGLFAGRGEINTHEKHTKHMNATVDGTYYLFKSWSLSGSVDLAAYDDIVGTENQWLNLGTAWNTHSFWIPDFRLGYHKNLVGSELTTAALGLSLFDSITLDMEMALDNIESDGQSAPRKIGFSLAIEEKF